MTIEFLAPSYSISPNPDNHLNSRDPDGDGTEETGTTDLGDPPAMTAFENHMVDPGQDRAQEIIDNDRAKENDRDVLRAMKYIRNYTGTTQPYRDAEIVWRDGILDKIFNHGAMQAHKMYVIGLSEEYAQEGHQDSLDGLAEQADDKAWQGYNASEGIDDPAERDKNWHSIRIRETGHSMHAMLEYERHVGKSNMQLADRGGDSNFDASDPDNRYKLLLHKLEVQVHQMRFRDWSSTTATADEYIRPFMFGIAFHSLAMYMDVYGNSTQHWMNFHWSDPLTMMEDFLAWVYEEAEDRNGSGQRIRELDCGRDSNGDLTLDGSGSGYGCWVYSEPDGLRASPDLENVVSACYMALAKFTGKKKYADYADEMFRTGHEEGYLGGVKQFTQQYYFMPAFFEWRNQF